MSEDTARNEILEEFGMTDDEVSKRLEEMEKEQEAERERRIEIAKRAPMLTKAFLKGKDYRTEDIVKLKDGSFFKVILRPLGDGDLYKAFDDVGVENIPSPGRRVEIPQIKFARLADKLALLSIESDLTDKELTEILEYGETTRIGTDIMSKLFKRESVESGVSKDMDVQAGFLHKDDQ